MVWESGTSKSGRGRGSQHAIYMPRPEFEFEFEFEKGKRGNARDSFCGIKQRDMYDTVHEDPVY